MRLGKNRARLGLSTGAGAGREAAGPGSPCLQAADIVPRAALLLETTLCSTFMPFTQINHKARLRGSGAWEAPSKFPCAQPRQGATGQGAGSCPHGDPQPVPLPSQGCSHGHGRTQETLALD